MVSMEDRIQIARDQLARVERAFEDLRHEVQPKNPELFLVMAEGYVFEIEKLRGEIDSLSGVQEVRESVG